MPVKIPQAALATAAATVIPNLTTGSATVTIKGSDGKSVQVSQAMVAQAQLGLVQPSSDGTVTLPGPDGKPVKIPQAALATAASSLPSITAGAGTVTIKGSDG